MRCPGQDSRYWGAEAIFEVECPNCGGKVEFFKDEPTRRCKGCGQKLVNPKMDFGCAAYCKFAEQCLGDLPPELVAQREDLLKDRVAIEMKRYFAKDFKRIGHATKVARYAEEIVREEGGEPAVVLCAAYLHDIGIHEAERKHGSTAGCYQEEEGPPIAREILKRLGAKEELIEEVCDIIGHHHHPRSEETLNFKILYDADLIVNLEEAQKEKGSKGGTEGVLGVIEKGFFTDSGRRLAREVLSASESSKEE
jgi:HD superfamily phosphohydrolase YqeK/DNA-directed RNA polymerase subunit RPC12/RpoP